MAVDLEQFSQEPIYRAQAPCARVLEDLQQLREPDNAREQKPPGVQGAVQFLEGTRLEELTVEADRVDLTLVMDAPWAAVDAPSPGPGSPLNGTRVVATAFLSLYQFLHLSRALDKKAAHPTTG